MDQPPAGVQQVEIHLCVDLVGAGGYFEARDDHELIRQLGLQPIEEHPLRLPLIHVFN